jgi:predicted hydrocarbon binding protein
VANIKGRVILNARDFVVARDGSEGWRRVLDVLAAEDRETLASMVPVGWYDIRLSDRVNRSIVDGLGGGAMDVMHALGRYAAEEDLKTIHRLFLRMANPAFVLERLAEFWGRYQDSGVWTVVRARPNRVLATLDGWGAEDEATCVRLGSYTKRLFELVGAKDVYVDRRACRARGDPACIFDGGWT